MKVNKYAAANAKILITIQILRELLAIVQRRLLRVCLERFAPFVTIG
jgi:hypothetical protein